MRIAIFTSLTSIKLFKKQLNSKMVDIFYVTEDIKSANDFNDIYYFDKGNDKYYEFLSFHNINFVIVFGWSTLIPLNILKKIDFYNIHPSLLPKYRGVNPIVHQLFNKEKISGITLHKMNEKFDAGPIYMQKQFVISKNDTDQTIFFKIFKCILEILPKFFDAYINNEEIILKDQNELEATYYSLKDLNRYIIDKNFLYEEFINIYKLKEFMPIKIKIDNEIYILNSFSDKIDNLHTKIFYLKDKSIYVNL